MQRRFQQLATAARAKERVYSHLLFSNSVVLGALVIPTYPTTYRHAVGYYYKGWSAVQEGSEAHTTRTIGKPNVHSVYLLCVLLPARLPCRLVVGLLELFDEISASINPSRTHIDATMVPRFVIIGLAPYFPKKPHEMQRKDVPPPICWWTGSKYPANRTENSETTH